MIPVWGAAGLAVGAFVLGVSAGLGVDGLCRWLAKDKS